MSRGVRLFSRPLLESVRVQAMTTIDDELKAPDEAYLKKFKDLSLS
jgi:hypothetical protein